MESTPQGKNGDFVVGTPPKTPAPIAGDIPPTQVYDTDGVGVSSSSPIPSSRAEASAVSRFLHRQQMPGSFPLSEVNSPASSHHYPTPAKSSSTLTIAKNGDSEQEGDPTVAVVETKIPRSSLSHSLHVPIMQRRRFENPDIVDTPRSSFLRGREALDRSRRIVSDASSTTQGTATTTTELYNSDREPVEPISQPSGFDEWLPNNSRVANRPSSVHQLRSRSSFELLPLTLQELESLSSEPILSHFERHGNSYSLLTIAEIAARQYLLAVTESRDEDQATSRWRNILASAYQAQHEPAPWTRYPHDQLYADLTWRATMNTLSYDRENFNVTAVRRGSDKAPPSTPASDDDNQSRIDNSEYDSTVIHTQNERFGGSESEPHDSSRISTEQLPYNNTHITIRRVASSEISASEINSSPIVLSRSRRSRTPSLLSRSRECSNEHESSGDPHVEESIEQDISVRPPTPLLTPTILAGESSPLHLAIRLPAPVLDEIATLDATNKEAFAENAEDERVGGEDLLDEDFFGGSVVRRLSHEAAIHYDILTDEQRVRYLYLKSCEDLACPQDESNSITGPIDDTSEDDASASANAVVRDYRSLSGADGWSDADLECTERAVEDNGSAERAAGTGRPLSSAVTDRRPASRVVSTRHHVGMSSNDADAEDNDALSDVSSSVDLFHPLHRVSSRSTAVVSQHRPNAGYQPANEHELFYGPYAFDDVVEDSLGSIASESYSRLNSGRVWDCD